MKMLGGTESFENYVRNMNPATLVALGANEILKFDGFTDVFTLSVVPFVLSHVAYNFSMYRSLSQGTYLKEQLLETSLTHPSLSEENIYKEVKLVMDSYLTGNLIRKFNGFYKDFSGDKWKSSLDNLEKCINDMYSEINIDLIINNGKNIPDLKSFRLEFILNTIKNKIPFSGQWLDKKIATLTLSILDNNISIFENPSVLLKNDSENESSFNKIGNYINFFRSSIDETIPDVFFKSHSRHEELIADIMVKTFIVKLIFDGPVNFFRSVNSNVADELSTSLHNLSHFVTQFYSEKRESMLTTKIFKALTNSINYQTSALVKPLHIAKSHDNPKPLSSSFLRHFKDYIFSSSSPYLEQGISSKPGGKSLFQSYIVPMIDSFIEKLHNPVSLSLLYQNQLKNWTFNGAKAPQFVDHHNINDTRSFMIDEFRKLSVGPKRILNSFGYR